MSYEIAKRVRVNRNTNIITFVSKANNDTAPFRKHTKSIPDYLTARIGGIIQDKQTTPLMIEWHINPIVRTLSDDFWFDLNRDGIEVMRRDVQELFAHFCDRLRNELPEGR